MRIAALFLAATLACTAVLAAPSGGSHSTTVPHGASSGAPAWPKGATGAPPSAVSGPPWPRNTLPPIQLPRTVPVVDTLFGVTVGDPYRWMEGADNTETNEWLRAQGRYTREFIDRLPGRRKLYDRVRALGLSYGNPSGVQLAGGRAFYEWLGAGEQLPKLMVREPDGTTRLLVDPAKMGADTSTHASLNSYSPSPDGSLIACDLAMGGSEVSTIHVYDVATGKERPDVIDRVWGENSASWLPDGSGFFYAQMAPPAKDADPLQGQRVRMHRLGTNAANDPIVFYADRAPTMPLAPEEFPSLWAPPGSPWVFAFAGGAHPESRIALARLADLDTTGKAATRWTKIAEYDDGIESFDYHAERIYLLSHKGVSGRQVLSMPVDKPDLSQARIEIAEDATAPLERIAAAHDALYATRVGNGQARLLRLPWNQTSTTTITLPYAGMVNGVSVDPLRDGVAFDLVGWTHPVEYHAFDPKTQLLTKLIGSSYPEDMSGVVSEEVDAVSADGTHVPLSILRKKSLALDSSHPAILWAYGGYGISQNPWFSPSILGWLERGGVFAVAHVRGGSEKGHAWQIAGTGPNKMNGIADFIACGEYLVNKHYTSRAKLAAEGGSMGGVLVGRAITLRPDLFGAAHISVGIVNPMRILAAENGANQKMELGDPSTETGFKALLAMDPYLHVKPGTAYPAVIFTVGLNDRRVAPWMTAKFAARLQAATAGGRPVMVRVESDAGHGIGSTRDQTYAEKADVWSVLLAVAGDPAFHPTPITTTVPAQSPKP